MRIIAIAVLVACMCLPAEALEISNFRSGLACTNTAVRDDASGWICHVTEDVFVTDQGQCRYNGEDRLCTWMGFEFDYLGAEPGDRLECTIGQSRPTAFGNPMEELESGATSQEFTLPLDKTEGHFYNPQYITFALRSADETMLVSDGRCFFQGREVFRYTHRLHFPAPPKHGAGA